MNERQLRIFECSHYLVLYLHSVRGESSKHWKNILLATGTYDVHNILPIFAIQFGMPKMQNDSLVG